MAFLHQCASVSPYRPIVASQSDKLTLQDCLEVGRQARVGPRSLLAAVSDCHLSSLPSSLAHLLLLSSTR